MHVTLTVNFNTATSSLRNNLQRGLSQHILDVLGISGSSQPLAGQSATVSPNEFYQAAFMPSPESYNDLSTVDIPGLETTLYPFQRRTVQWLLMREGVKYGGTGPERTLQLAEHHQPPNSSLPFSFSSLNDVNGQQFFVSDLYHVVTRDITPFREPENSLRGGILAEEMGLGKTVEIISLILTHERGPYPRTEMDTDTNRVIHPTGATLVVTPDTLQNQWVAEFKKHAPSLSVMKYPGMKVWSKDKAFNTEQQGTGRWANRFISKLTNCDVVITTYNVLQTELHYAEVPPERSMRHERRHERHTSPLVEIGWWRICLDEAQQIDSGVSSTAKVACLIPRVNAWAVTGTPIKDDPNDLWGLLLFLRYEPFASCQFIWKALLNSHKSLFGSLFSRIALRHSKRAVRDELNLPSQRRYVMTMPFTAIEEHHYRSQFKKLVAKAGLNEKGIPIDEDWDPEDASVIDCMKKALASLRQIILHPELDSLVIKLTGYKTLAEHLETMIEQSEAAIKSHQRSYLIAKLNKGQLFENTPAVKEALRLWEEVREELEPIVLEVREELQKELDSAQQEQSDGTNDPSEEPSDAEMLDAEESPNNELLETAESPDDETPDDETSDDETPDDETPETAKVGECRRKLRLFLDLQHRVMFLLASAFFQIKSNKTFTQPNSDEFRRLEQREIEGYELAQKIRREILQGPFTKASKLIKKLQERANNQSFVEISEIVTSDLHGLKSGQIVTDLQTLSTSLNEQAEVIDEWREQVIQLLLKPLVDAENEEDKTGEEFEDSTMVQDHLMVYTLALRAVISDRQEALTGFLNERVRYETTAAEAMANRGEGHAPEKLLELLDVRQEVKPPGLKSLRGVVSAARELSTDLRHDASMGSNRARVELQIVTTQLRAIQGITTKQNKTAARLKKELDFFVSIMNARVDFYRQLQSVSDNVAPLGPEIIWDREGSWFHYDSKEKDVRRRAAHWHSVRRRLICMKEGSNDPCAICNEDDFILAALTTCGHTFCKECIVKWLNTRPTCPFCKRYQTKDMLNEFTRGQVVAKEQSPEPLGSSLRGKAKGQWGVYSNIPENQKHAIQKIKLDGPSYSTKVDTLIKHLMWLRREDPGAKSIIFTQFQRFLAILKQALVEHGISSAEFSYFGNKSAEIQRFKDDPSVECLLMDAKSHSSGLNLVNANHVFLCEPLLHTALELQAIARVDRIGQKHETTVWLYIVEGTVEENIHAISEQRRLAHTGEGIGKGKVTEMAEGEAAEAANSVESARSDLTRLITKDGKGEVVDKGDLWSCLFGDEERV
ncbi:SNF2 family N-terminal domain-containing protein [Xylaria digitata]|nr:SNF2 family N-terminal domain-containing protein [Xylaria digitata]